MGLWWVTKFMFRYLSIIMFYILSLTDSYSANIKIKYKINDKIITNLDIINEKKYLIFLRPNLENIPENEVLKLCENSLIRETIKNKELDKIFTNFNNDQFINGIKKNLFDFKKVKNEKEFLSLLKENKISYEKILNKIKYEGLWNELIFKKYNSLVKIDKINLKRNLIDKMNSEKKLEYNLSELLFEIETNEKYEDKYKNILEYINKNSFKSAAYNFSIANSANKGGEIGWMKETLLSQNLNTELKNLNVGEITEPIKHPNGYLLLKINDKKEMKEIKNLDKELKEVIQFEKNKQLNQFSLLFYKKLKQNSVIYEY